MTKDAEKVLRRLYRAYKKRRRVLGRRQAMDFLIADEDAALEYEESRLSRGLSCLLDVFSKLRP